MNPLRLFCQNLFRKPLHRKKSKEVTLDTEDHLRIVSVLMHVERNLKPMLEELHKTGSMSSHIKSEHKGILFYYLESERNSYFPNIVFVCKVDSDFDKSVCHWMDKLMSTIGIQQNFKSLTISTPHITCAFPKQRELDSLTHIDSGLGYQLCVSSGLVMVKLTCDSMQVPK